MLLGAMGVVGNVLATKNAARTGRFGGADMSVHWANAVMVLGLLVLAALGRSSWGFAAAACIWGLGVFASNSSQQARLAAASPALAGASIALNTSMIYLGQAAGTFAGGAVIAAAGYWLLPWVSATLLVVAVGLSLYAAHAARPVN
jgi:predicted MFS family arabinose efflux permease